MAYGSGKLNALHFTHAVAGFVVPDRAGRDHFRPVAAARRRQRHTAEENNHDAENPRIGPSVHNIISRASAGSAAGRLDD